MCECRRWAQGGGDYRRAQGGGRGIKGFIAGKKAGHFWVLTNTRSLELFADSNEEAQRWIRVLQQTANMALGAPELVEVSGARGAMQAALDAAAANGDALDAKAVKGCLETTARKVLAVRFPAASVAATVACTCERGGEERRGRGEKRGYGEVKEVKGGRRGERR